MSMNNLTIDGEFRYIVQWFNEWSEFQRDDFVPILINYLKGVHTNEEYDNDVLPAVSAAAAPINMNGLPHDLELNGRPMSLFQCRIKLFNQWNRKWPSEFKEKLQHKITEIDDKVGGKIKSALNPCNGSLTNGSMSNELNMNQLNELCDVNLGTDLTYERAAQLVTLNDPMTEVLNNETSVDDIDAAADVTNVVTTTSKNTDINYDANNVNNETAGSENLESDGYSSTIYNETTNECGKPVEQVEQLQNLQLNEKKEKVEGVLEDVIIVEQPSITVAVNPVAVVSQTITSNTEVPLVV